MIRNLLVISVGWAILILIMSGMPGDSIPQSKFWSIPHFDKLVHMALYLPLGFFLVAEFRLSTSAVLNKFAIPATLLIVATYGGLIELAQDYLFVQRSADWYDLISDVFGGLLGIIIFYIVGFKLFKKLRKF